MKLKRNKEFHEDNMLDYIVSLSYVVKMYYVMLAYY